MKNNTTSAQAKITRTAASGVRPYTATVATNSTPVSSSTAGYIHEIDV
jgi:hypothetical protein